MFSIVWQQWCSLNVSNILAEWMKRVGIKCYSCLLVLISLSKLLNAMDEILFLVTLKKKNTFVSGSRTVDLSLYYFIVFSFILIN